MGIFSEVTTSNEHEHELSFPERISQLIGFFWQIIESRDQETIQTLTLREAPRLVEAESGLIWLWDADQKKPVLLVSLEGHSTTFSLPNALLQLFQEACAGSRVVHVGEERSGTDWPAAMAQRSIALVPLATPNGCLGVFTVQKRPGAVFTEDDLLLLALLGNKVAIAIQNNKLHHNERRLTDLLQTLIRLLVQASSDQTRPPEEFLQSMAHVAEGLTRADAVCIQLALAPRSEPMLVCSGALAASSRELLAATGHQLCAATAGLPSIGRLADLLTSWEDQACPPLYYVSVRIHLDGEAAGCLFALHTAPLTDDQVNFLYTVAEQTGEGIRHKQQAERNQRLLFELSNVNFVAEEITRTFDPLKISTIISEAAAKALNTPVAFCGYRQQDGAILIHPSTAVGLTPEIWTKFRLSENNAAIKEVLRLRRPTDSHSKKRRERMAFPFLTAQKVVDWLCVPMVAQPRTPDESPSARGVLMIADVRSRTFTEHEIALLSTYANQAALAMENSQLFDEWQRQLQQLNMLYQMRRDAGGTHDIGTILDRLLQAAGEMLHVPAALVTLTGEVSGDQQAEHVWGMHDVPLRELRWSSGKGIVGTVAQHRIPITSIDLRSDGRDPLLRDLATAHQLASSGTVPLRAQQSLLGTLTIFFPVTRNFSDAEMQLLQTMTTETAVGIQNARVSQRERQRTHELDSLVDNLRQQTPTTLQLVQELLDLIPPEETPSHCCHCMRSRMETLQVVQREVTEDAPTVVNVKNAITHLAAQRRQRGQHCAAWPSIHVSGVGVTLPLLQGQVLAIFIQEYLQAITTQEPVPAVWDIHIAFQQFGQEALVHIEDNAPHQATIPAPLLAWLQRRLPGDLTESAEDGHQVRYRFLAP